MKRLTIQILGLCAALATVCMSCDRKAGALKGQTNTTLIFHGKAIDQDGKPVEGAKFGFLVESFPKDWTFGKRGEPLIKQTLQAQSGPDGTFRLDIEGHILRVTKAEKTGFRHFYELVPDGDAGTFPNTFFRLNSWSDATYKSDPGYPATYVFVKDGVLEVSALPSKGGFDSGNGQKWRLNKSGWPKQPSLDDVVQKQATTRTQ